MRSATLQQLARALRIGMLVTSTSAMSASAQAHRVVDPRPVCQNCRIQLHHIVTLGAGSGDDYVDVPWSVLLWNDHWIVTHLAKPHAFSVYNRSGDWLADVGERGEGPGEFRLASRAAVVADSLLVFDGNLRRVSVYSSDFTLARTVALPSFDMEAAYPMAGREWLVHANVRGSIAPARPLHVTDLSGGRLRSFGNDTPSIRADMPHLHLRTVSPPSEDRIWIARRTAYVLENWRLSDGVRLETLTRDVAWFRPHGRAGFVGSRPSEPPAPGIVAVWTDDNGLLWVFIRVAAEDWRSAVVRRGVLHGRRIHGISNLQDMYDTIIEVIDPASGRLVTRGRSRHAALDASRDGFFISSEQSPEGALAIHVWRPQITRTGRLP